MVILAFESYLQAWLLAGSRRGHHALLDGPNGGPGPGRRTIDGRAARGGRRSNRGAAAMPPIGRFTPRIDHPHRGPPAVFLAPVPACGTRNVVWEPPGGGHRFMTRLSTGIPGLDD